MSEFERACVCAQYEDLVSGRLGEGVAWGKCHVEMCVVVSFESSVEAKLYGACYCPGASGVYVTL